MSKFLESFIDDIVSTDVGCEGFGDLNIDWDSINRKIGSIGENARRMLEIGILQDDLAKLGFKIENNHLDLMVGKYKFYKVLFSTGGVLLFLHNKLLISTGLDYTSPTWQEDLINRVKELIND